MPQKPISRHYDYGCTFRWIQGDGHIAVKRGYVCEGQTSVAVRWPSQFKIEDRPGDNPHNDKDTWLAAIPVNPGYWSDDRHFVGAINAWVKNNPKLVNLNDRTGRV